MLLIIYMAVMARLSGNGFGQRWGVSWLPEVLFTLPFGLAIGHVVSLDNGFVAGALTLLVGWAWSYGFMQSSTWMFLQWTEHSPNLERGGTLKPITDKIAGLFGYKLGDEGYSWVAAAIKGLLIGLPVGGAVLAVLWPLSYEAGSHVRGKVERFGIDPQAISEALTGVSAGIAILLFLSIVGGN